MERLAGKGLAHVITGYNQPVAEFGAPHGTLRQI